MASLQIRNLPEDVYQSLRARARAQNRSLAQQAIVDLRSGSEVTEKERRLEILDRIERRIAETGGVVLDPSPEELIRADRDR